jgi:hypothetical protein
MEFSLLPTNRIFEKAAYHHVLYEESYRARSINGTVRRLETRVVSSPDLAVLLQTTSHVSAKTTTEVISESVLACRPFSLDDHT